MDVKVLATRDRVTSNPNPYSRGGVVSGPTTSDILSPPLRSTFSLLCDLKKEEYHLLSYRNDVHGKFDRYGN